ncbi:hypothetical protein CSOJ01_13104 [Colletotrichum sojae]|uniref:Uncharacterized protein n=1 Tax=Colletotrichum sojae TaxID=2175907 RepID=A0A8H6ITS6_9PEZI|nr:hypothetical protein CSOJ01_13104 [Colletotrichum sojae]
MYAFTLAVAFRFFSRCYFVSQPLLSVRLLPAAIKFSIAIVTLLIGAVTAVPVFVDCETAADKASADATGLRCRNPAGQKNNNGNGNGNGNGNNRNGAANNRNGAANNRNGNNNNNNAKAGGNGGNNSIFVDCQTAADKASADATGLRCKKNPV